MSLLGRVVDKNPSDVDATLALQAFNATVIQNDWEHLRDPGVPVYCLFNTDLPTEMAYIYRSERQFAEVF